MLFIKSEDFDKLVAAYTAIKSNVLPAGVQKGLPLKGYVLCPSIDLSSQPAVYINPVFGTDPLGDGDIIVQTNTTKACPYPPGYPPTPPVASVASVANNQNK